MSTTWRGGIRGQQIAICTLIHFYVHGEPFNETSPMLSRLLTYTTRLIIQVDVPSPSLSHFMQLLTASLGDRDASNIERTTATIEKFIRASGSFAGLHNFFTKVERLLMTEDLYDEVQNITIKPADRLIDEQSPFGQFLQRCLDEYINVEDNDFAKIVYLLQSWINGEGASEEGSGREGSPPASGNAGYATSAIRRGDYALARAETEGFFDRYPQDQMHQSLQETLFNNAFFHYQTKAYESARSSLNEALRLSRGVHDLQCITACHNLLRLVEYEEEDQKGGSYGTIVSHTLDTPLTFSGIELWRVGKAIDSGRPLLSVLKSTQNLLRPMKGKDHDQGMSETQVVEARLWQNKLWSHVGSETNAHLCQHFSLDLRNVADEGVGVYSDVGLTVRPRDIDNLATRLRAVFEKEMISSLDLDAYDNWQRGIWAAVRDASKGDLLLRDALRMIQPEAIQETDGFDVESEPTASDEEENEATFGVSDKVSLSSYLKMRLAEARKLREEGDDCAAALAIAVHVMRRGEEAHLFILYREALLECAEALLDLGNANQAKAVLDEAMPQLLTDKSARTRGASTWVYARTLLALSRQAEPTLSLVLPWLEKANKAYRECDCLQSLADVLYVQMRLFEHLEKPLDVQLAERDLHAVEREEVDGAERSQRLIDSIQSLIMLVGSRVIAGG